MDGPPETSRTTRYPALHVEVVDATGAGDALNGILAAELAHGAEFGDALRLATAGAALSTRAVGARTGLPTRPEVVEALG